MGPWFDEAASVLWRIRSVSSNLADIERSICNLTRAVRGLACLPVESGGFETGPDMAVVRGVKRPKPGKSGFADLDPDLLEQGWWVLVCGRPLDRSCFEARERARESLRQDLARQGVKLAEYVWIWDKTNRAQVVAARFHELGSAERLARELKGKGLDVRVVREVKE